MNRSEERYISDSQAPNFTFHFPGTRERELQNELLRPTFRQTLNILWWRDESFRRYVKFIHLFL